ncbi:hypothetical protein GLOIN_2v1869487 [Rhizophagus irregularis DAOM 181602=DAOM 197198]|nr:hypothetical protein GLOIN_2v1869487 [Rhizophagus irregularis DAOM 181602=DAOM 197198]
MLMIYANFLIYLSFKKKLRQIKAAKDLYRKSDERIIVSQMKRIQIRRSYASMLILGDHKSMMMKFNTSTECTLKMLHNGHMSSKRILYMIRKSIVEVVSTKMKTMVKKRKRSE